MSDGFVDFFGERFATPERFNVRRLTRFAAMAKKGVDSEDADGLAAIDGLLDQCLRPEDVARFDRVCDEHRPDFEELMAFAMSVIETVGERPTRRSSDSSDGPSIIEPSSTGGSSSPVVARLEKQGRPDLALLVTQAQAQAS